MVTVTDLEDSSPDIAIVEQVLSCRFCPLAKPLLQKPSRFERDPDRRLGPIDRLGIDMLTRLESENCHTLCGQITGQRSR